MGTVVNRALQSLYGRSLKITLTVPLKRHLLVKISQEYFCFFLFINDSENIVSHSLILFSTIKNNNQLLTMHFRVKEKVCGIENHYYSCRKDGSELVTIVHHNTNKRKKLSLFQKLKFYNPFFSNLIFLTAKFFNLTDLKYLRSMPLRCKDLKIVAKAQLIYNLRLCFVKF